MKGIKKIVLACSLEDEAMKQMENFSNYGWSEECEIHLVHIFKIQFMFNEFTPYVYPEEDQRPTISEYVVQSLKTFRNKIIPEDSNVSTTEVCLFDNNPKKKMLEYLDEVRPDLVVVSGREKHGIEGLFTSSFTDYLLKFSHYDILVLRPKK